MFSSRWASSSIPQHFGLDLRGWVEGYLWNFLTDYDINKSNLTRYFAKYSLLVISTSLLSPCPSSSIHSHKVPLKMLKGSIRWFIRTPWDSSQKIILPFYGPRWQGQGTLFFSKGQRIVARYVLGDSSYVRRERLWLIQGTPLCGGGTLEGKGEGECLDCAETERLLQNLRC